VHDRRGVPATLSCLDCDDIRFRTRKSKFLSLPPSSSVWRLRRPLGASTTGDSILIVDDHRDSREMLAEYLTRCGFAVLEAADGIEAIEIATRLHPSVILMDIMMPQLDGWEATHRLKADIRTRDITIIALSGFALTDARQLARDAGCDDFIPQPCDPVYLADLLRRILNRPAEPGNSARAAVEADKRTDETVSTPPVLHRKIHNLSLADAVAADIALDDAIAAAIERHIRRRE
jgi:two-component system, cell cycle response regulator DivK